MVLALVWTRKMVPLALEKEEKRRSRGRRGGLDVFGFLLLFRFLGLFDFLGVLGGLGRGWFTVQFVEPALEGCAKAVGEDCVGFLGIGYDLENAHIGEPIGEVLVQAVGHGEQVDRADLRQLRSGAAADGEGQKAG